MSFKGLHQEGFDQQHDSHESQSIGEDHADVEKLKIGVQLESDPVGAAGISTTSTIFQTRRGPERAAAAM